MEGLYDPQHEHDSCGVGFVVDIKGRRSNAIVRQAMQVLINLLHRGACGCEANTGDGAGILIQTPDKFLRKAAARSGITLPRAGEYGAGLVFLSHDDAARARTMSICETIIKEEGQVLLGWRDVPTQDHHIGPSARAVEPVFKHLLIGRPSTGSGQADSDPNAFERKLFVIRKRIEHAVDKLPTGLKRDFYIVSLSSDRKSIRLNSSHRT